MRYQEDPFLAEIQKMKNRAINDQTRRLLDSMERALFKTETEEDEDE